MVLEADLLDEGTGRGLIRLFALVKDDNEAGLAREGVEEVRLIEVHGDGAAHVEGEGDALGAPEGVGAVAEALDDLFRDGLARVGGERGGPKAEEDGDDEGAAGDEGEGGGGEASYAVDEQGGRDQGGDESGRQQVGGDDGAAEDVGGDEGRGDGGEGGEGGAEDDVSEGVSEGRV